PLDERPVLDGAADDVDAPVEPAADQLGAGHAVAHQADDVGAAFEQGPDGPGPDEPGAAGDEDAPVAPESVRGSHVRFLAPPQAASRRPGASQVFHGARPEAHCSLSSL